MTYEEYEIMTKERLEINKGHLKNGVLFVDINTAYIEKDVVIGEGTLIGSCVTLDKGTQIGKSCVIGQNSRVVNSIIGDKTELQSSVIIDSIVGSETKIGPFAYLRPNSKVGNHCKVGDFVEVKNSSMGDGSKASHLTYIGDSDVGSDVNIGCGVVFVNYDGKNKHRSVVGDGSFIGCNTNLVSPINVSEGAYIAAGSTVTQDVPKGALCVARAKQRIIEGWVEKRELIKKR
jgi:bifunctional UDP-N-acetylglucosamine pyrophosphorylase / glucosamine-1-phosphate N-acetyltransferase